MHLYKITVLALLLSSTTFHPAAYGNALKLLGIDGTPGDKLVQPQHTAEESAGLTSNRSTAPEELPAALRNADFETTQPDGSLADWSMFREGYLDVNPALAKSGNNSIRSSFLFGWGQDLKIPVSPFQTFAVAGYARREIAHERAGVRTAYFRESGEHIKDLNSFSPVASPAAQYGPFWTVQEVPDGAEWMTLFLRGNGALEWLRFDDLSTFSEQLRFDAHTSEEGWDLSAGASNGGGGLIMSEGTLASQRVAVGGENQSYFVWGRYQTAAEAEFIVREQWLPRDDSESTATTSTIHLLSAPEGTFLSDPGRMTGASSGQGRVVIENTSPDSVTITSLRRGFAKVEPAVLTAGPASPDGSLKLTAAWPQYLSTATVQIVTSAGAPADATTITLKGTSIRAEWDPADAAEGRYNARFTLYSGDGEVVEVDRPFTLIREDSTTTTIPAVKRPEFTRAIWLLVNGSAGDIMQMFETLKQDGFQFALVLTTQPKFADVRQAAETHDIPFVVFAPEAIKVFREYEQRSWFSKAEYVARMKKMFAPLLGSELFQGIYVIDEPTRPEELETLRRMTLSLTQDGTLGVPYAVFIDTVTSNVIAPIQPPVALVDTYPYHLNTYSDGTSALLERIPLMNQQARDFAALGRDLWILPQGFANQLNNGGHYPVPPTLNMAQLGAVVLSGARGTMPFFYSSVGGTMEGLRWPGLTPTPKLAPFQQFNEIMERLGPTVMQLGVPLLRDDAPYPFAVSTADEAAGNRYVYVLNADEATTRTLLVGLQSAPAEPIIDLVAERALAVSDDGKVEVELPAGDWALFSVGMNTVVDIIAVPVPPPPPLTTVELPVTHQFSVTVLGGHLRPVQGLKFNAEGNAIAATVPSSPVPSVPQFYHLQPDGTTQRETGPVSWLSQINTVTNNGLYATASSFIGMELYMPGTFDGPPAAEFKGYTGGAYNALRNGDTLWLSIDIGMRQLQVTEAGLVPMAVGWADRGNYLDLFGPFADGSVSVLVSNFGISNVKPGQLHEFNHRYEIVDAVDRNADMNSNNLLAAPRHQRGVALFQLGATGEPQLVANIATDALDASAVSWVYDNLLAVADGYKSVRFYWILNNEAKLVGTWRPPLPDYFYMLSMDVAEGKLAVGLHDGRVVVADITNLEPPSSPVQDWVLFE